jgi:mannose-1-phosphate guanylyltransferase/phosphomannomutase
MSYFIEDVPLGTGGSVKNAKGFLDSTFLVISGDAFTNIDITKAVKFHKENNSKATLILKKEPIPLEYGVVITGEDGRIKKFLEKPGWGEVFSDTINTGIYILEPEVMNYYKAGENFDFGKDLFPRLLKDGIPMYGYITSDYWCDVGDLHSYMNTHVDFLEKKVFPVEDAEEVKKGIWIGRGTIVEEGAQLFPPVYIGKNTIVKKDSKIYGCTVIGDNCYLGENTSIYVTMPR